MPPISQGKNSEPNIFCKSVKSLKRKLSLKFQYLFKKAVNVE